MVSSSTHTEVNSLVAADHYLTLQEVAMLQLILEEFGKWVKNTTSATEAQREQFFTLAYNAVSSVSCTHFTLTPIPTKHV